MLILKESLFAVINESFIFKFDDNLIRVYPLARLYPATD